MTFDLITDQRRECLSDGAVEFADHNFWLGTKIVCGTLDEGFTSTHYDSLTHYLPSSIVIIDWERINLAFA